MKKVEIVDCLDLESLSGHLLFPVYYLLLFFYIFQMSVKLLRTWTSVTLLYTSYYLDLYIFPQCHIPLAPLIAFLNHSNVIQTTYIPETMYEPLSDWSCFPVANVSILGHPHRTRSQPP